MTAEPVRLILDTDINSDCDDAGALAVLHALSRRGEVELLGVVCSVAVPWTALCVAAINEAYGRADLPVALVQVPDFATSERYAPYRRHCANARTWHGGPLYNEVVGGDWQAAHPDWTPREAVDLYRELLAAAPDNSVVICAIGTLTALEQLLDSGPEARSPLSGEALVAAKVRRLVSMAESPYPEGEDCFNWAMDKPAAARVVNDWPAPLTVSDWGREVFTGRRFLAAAPETHPVARSLRVWFGNMEPQRPSWDQLAAICAVRGGGDLFVEHGGHGLGFEAELGRHQYVPLAPGRPERTWLEPRQDDEALARAVEDLMIESVAG